jgi:hypothetical protein
MNSTRDPRYVHILAVILGVFSLLLCTGSAFSQYAGPGARGTAPQQWNPRARITAGPSNLISDDFNSPALNAELWNFVNPLGDGTVAVNGTEVKISVPAGTAHDAWTGANNVPRLLQATNDADFALIVKIDSPMTTQYQTSGIMVQESPSTYLRFDINSDGSVLHAFAASVFNNVATPQTGFDFVVDSNGVVPLYIGVRRTGNNWEMGWSRDDSTWFLVLNFNYGIVVNAVGVFAGNQGSDPPAFTASFDFFQTDIPKQPTLLSPLDGTTNQPVPSQLIWAAYQGAATYKVQVATNPTFATGIAVNDSTVTDTTKILAGLARGTLFYWRVSARNSSGGASAFSTTRSFTTAPPAPVVPTLLSPADGAIDVATSSVIRWRKSAGALAYHLQISQDSTFAGSLLVNDSTLTDTVKTLSGAQNSTKYFWRVNSSGTGGASTYSAVWRFTTVTAAPPTPSLVTPANDAINQPTALLLVWGSSAGATSYHLQLTTDSLFISGLLVNDTTIVDTAKNVSALTSYTRYFWRVRAKNAGGISAFTPVRHFTTLIGAPVLQSPANGGGGQPLTVTLRWGRVSGAIAYRLQMATDSTFASGIIKNDSTIVDTSRVISGLVINQRYFWRVSAREGSGSGAFSPTWSFLTATPLPDPFVLLAPASGSVASGDSAKFLWHSTQPLVQFYDLEYAADSLFVFKIVDSTLTDTSKTVRGLITDTRYFWRVRAKNPGGWGSFTSSWSFRTSVTGVSNGTELPTEYSLDQNYPNPFNPSTTISFAMPSAGHVKLEVYNLLGEKVAVLLDETRAAGFHSVTFDARNALGMPLSSGVYLYRLETSTPQHLFVRKMIVVK